MNNQISDHLYENIGCLVSTHDDLYARVTRIHECHNFSKTLWIISFII